MVNVLTDRRAFPPNRINENVQLFETYLTCIEMKAFNENDVFIHDIMAVIYAIQVKNHWITIYIGFLFNH